MFVPTDFFLTSSGTSRMWLVGDRSCLVECRVSTRKERYGLGIGITRNTRDDEQNQETKEPKSKHRRHQSKMERETRGSPRMSWDANTQRPRRDQGRSFQSDGRVDGRGRNPSTDLPTHWLYTSQIQFQTETEPTNPDLTNPGNIT